MIETSKIENVLKNYNLLEKTPIILLRESADNFVFVVGETHKSIVRVSKRLPIQDIVFEYKLLQHLDSKKISIPKVILNTNHDSYSLIDGAVCVVFDFLFGAHIQVDKDHLPTRIQAYNAGCNLGLMTEALKDFVTDVPRERDILKELKRVLSHESFFKQNFEGGQEFLLQVEKALKFGTEHKDQISIIHNDYRPGNVFFDTQDNVVGLIDFDWACVGPSIKDLALAVVEWSFPDGADEPDMMLFDAFLEGYNSVVVNKIQKDTHLFEWITFTTLSDCATYFCDLVEDPNSTKRIIKSFMYRKYVYFSKLIK